MKSKGIGKTMWTIVLLILLILLLALIFIYGKEIVTRILVKGPG